MNQVYLLLRNNQQTGPYDLEQILQLQLKPFDLVWVNGKSAAWQYPGEIPALKPHVPPTPQPDLPFRPIETAAMEYLVQSNRTFQSKPRTIDKIFVSLPKSFVALPSKEEPLKQPFQEPAKESIIIEHVQRREEEHKQNTQPADYENPLKEAKLKNKWNAASPKRNKVIINRKDALIVVILAALITTGYYVISKPSLIAPKVYSKNSVASPAVQEDEELPKVKSPETNAIKQQYHELIAEANLPTSGNHPKKSNLSPGKRKHLSNQKQTIVTSKEFPVVSIRNDTEVKPILRSESEPPVLTTTIQKEKKKKMGEVLKDLFTKTKKKPEEPNSNAVVLEEPKPSSDRKSVHREDQSNASSNTTKAGVFSFAEQIDISSNQSDNWMMGVKELKVTIRNRSNISLQSASVQVMYLDANNQLIDTKILNFKNVSAHGKLTLPAPDHQFADHITLQVNEVIAKEEGMAGNKIKSF